MNARWLRCGMVFLAIAGTGCDRKVGSEATPGPPRPVTTWSVSDWADWKKQETGPKGSVEIKAQLPETEAPAPGGEPLSPEAVKAGALILHAGEPFTCVKYEGPHQLDLSGYEIAWDAMRVEGGDFFAALTFPVGKLERCVSLVAGGWGGWVVGISCIGGQFASENETTRSIEFKSGRWYRFAVQATPEAIRAFIDGKEQFIVDVRHALLTMHPSEISRCIPLGFGSYQTTGAIRNVRVRALRPGELVPPEVQ
jgi:hypothetical protein